MQTILVFVLIPAAIYGVIALFTLWPTSARGPRYRSGQPWTYDPVWWNAGGAVDSPATRKSDESVPSEQSARTARGGARGNW